MIPSLTLMLCWTASHLCNPAKKVSLLSSITSSVPMTQALCACSIITLDIYMVHFVSFRSLLKYHPLSKTFPDQQI
jgi:hypothetical protein